MPATFGLSTQSRQARVDGNQCRFQLVIGDNLYKLTLTQSFTGDVIVILLFNMLSIAITQSRTLRPVYAALYRYGHGTSESLGWRMVFTSVEIWLPVEKWRRYRNQHQ